MKVRVISKPEFSSLLFVQTKRWWFPFWITAYYGDKNTSLKVAENIIETGNKTMIVMQGETK